ncbi:MAG: 3-dehydroquinate synthase [Candidatus Competibacteraceae bacterium]|nr:3-dehydroquinate synthase [Candidatus Competibacteraceae bacterium]
MEQTLSYNQENQDICSVFYGESSWAHFSNWLMEKKPTRLFVLVDDNTFKYCYPLLLSQIPHHIQPIVIVVPPGEQEKTIESAQQVWVELANNQANRNDYLLALGGGTITDLGGMVASLYKRGMPFVFVPTTLLAQTDASLGGKTGVDFSGYKNMIGTFALPQSVFICPEFLTTLDEQQWISGYAEMLKHGLIADYDYWQILKKSEIRNLDSLISRSVEIKLEIVQNDPYEKGWRKVLNFGHTIGHAIESFMLEPNKTPILHGHAIAAGMICESFISMQYCCLPMHAYNEISSHLYATFSKIHFREDDIPRLIHYMKADKKNDNDQIQMVLLEQISRPVFGIMVNEIDIANALREYILK